MKKRWMLFMAALLLSAFLPACAVKEESSDLLTLKELPAEQEGEKIGNQIPQWILDADWNVPFYVLTSSDLQKFDAYAKEHFADYSDPYWTREQSDAVYLGQGIELFALDCEAQMNRVIYYPVMLNGVIVSGYEVYELLDSHEIRSQGGPVIVNELNAVMALTSEEMPAILGYNHQNLIAVIGDCYYVLDIDHMDGSEVVTEDIPAMDGAAYTVVDAVKPFCGKQTAQGEDISAVPANPVHHCTQEDDGTDYTNFSYVYFGSYPQSEVTDQTIIAAIDSAIEAGDKETDGIDAVVAGDAETISIDGDTVETVGTDVELDGTKYRRISEDDCNNTDYFDDVENNGYRYFKWEPIKWRVLDSNDDGTLFVVVDKALDCKCYNDELVDITWENSTIRSWLNGSFYRSAFSSAEQNAIEPWYVLNEDNPYYGTEGGNDTTDHVYLLSIGEVTNERYGFCSDYYTCSASRRLHSSEYAHARGVYRNRRGDGYNCCWWWLRSPGSSSTHAAYVSIYGYVSRNGNFVNYDNHGVAPALHINLLSDLWSVAGDGGSREENEN